MIELLLKFIVFIFIKIVKLYKFYKDILVFINLVVF